MRKLNKILLLFLAIIVVSLVAIWEFLQSDIFGTNLSKTVNKITKSQFGATVEFENLNFQLFPPGANLNNVSITIDNQKLQANATSSKLGIYFNLLDSFQTKLTVKELFVEDGVIDLAPFKTKADSKKEALNVSRLTEIIETSMPFTVKRVFLRDVLVKYGDVNQFINMAAVSLKSESLALKTDIKNLELGKYIEHDQTLDQIQLEAEVFDGRIDVKHAKVNVGINKFLANGTIDNYSKSPDLDLKGSFLGEISEVRKFIDLKAANALREGLVVGDFEAKGDIDNHEVKVDLIVSDFKTDYVHGDQLELKGRANNQHVMLEQAKFSAGGERVSLEAPFKLYDFDRKTLGEQTVALRAKNLDLNNVLRYLGDTLEPLKGNITGKMLVSFHNGAVRIFSDEKLVAQKLGVLLKNSKKPILKAERAVISNPVFHLKNGLFTMSASAEIGKTNFDITGKVENGEVDFLVKDGKIALDELGPFFGFKIFGEGAFDLSAKGKGLSTILKIKSQLKDFEFEGYKLNQLKSNVLFDFKDSNIVIGSFGGGLGKASLVGEAKINYKTLDVRANGELATQRYVDAKTMLEPLLGNLDMIPNDLFGAWNMEVVVGGKASLSDLWVTGAFTGRNNYIFDEGFEFAGFNLVFEKRKLSFNDIRLKKSTGLVAGSFSHSLPDKKTSYNFDIHNLPIAEITNYAKTPFAFNADLSGKILGAKDPQGQSALVDLNLLRTNLAGRDYDPSSLSLALNDGELDYDVNFLGNEFSSKGKLYLKKGAERSKVWLSVNSKDVQKPLSLLKFVDKSALKVKGNIDLRADLSFDGLDFKNSDIVANLRAISLSKGNLILDYKNEKGPQVLVKDGGIEKWDVELKGQRIYLISKGAGSFKNRYDVDNKFKIDAGFLEIFNAIISQASGTIRARARFFRNLFTEDYQATLVSDDLSFSSDKIPTEISSADLKINYKDNRVELESLKARLSSGTVSANGVVDFENIIPDIDFKVKFDEAGFPILKKSNVVVSGEGHLSGNKMPYSLTGEVKIQKLLIMNEITDFNKGAEGIFKKEFDYLPEQVSSINDNLVNMNIDISTIEPIMLNNSIADVGIVGNAQVVGGEDDFRLVGKFSLAPRANKISFKNNEYTLTKANIFFYERNKLSNPELDIAAYSVINDYRVNIKVYGPVEEFNMELGSEPALTQEDVLSLIAFGYTEDLSANLSDQEKESMTRAGVGSIIFDSFKINETLKNEFGLQVNLGTEITEEQRSYLSRVNNESAVGRVRSATTIEVKKKLNEAMNLSVTSTVGGSIGQKQSMNLNYNINNKLSFEGVYETRTSDEGGETINDSSLGADVKIRWSFR